MVPFTEFFLSCNVVVSVLSGAIQMLSDPIKMRIFAALL